MCTDEELAEMARHDDEVNAQFTALKAERNRLASFVGKLRDLAFEGGQNGETVRHSILQAFTEFDEEARSS